LPPFSEVEKNRFDDSRQRLISKPRKFPP